MSTSTPHAPQQVPDAVAPVIGAMSAYPAPWALCGGWAVDAWLGRISREHGDVDVAVFVQDQHVLFDHLHGWQLVPHSADWSGDSNERWDGRPLDHRAHFHGRIDNGEPVPPAGPLWPAQGFILDVQLNDRTDDAWTVHHDPVIAVPLEDAVRVCPWGVPAVVPEVLLFYKSRDLRRRDRDDFEALLPALAPRQRAWLTSAIARAGHPWLPQLLAAAGDAG